MKKHHAHHKDGHHKKMPAHKAHKHGHAMHTTHHKHHSHNSHGDESFVTGHKPSEGRTSFANMPSEVVMKEFPKYSHLRGKELNDTITGIDDVIAGSSRTADKHISNQK